LLGVFQSVVVAIVASHKYDTDLTVSPSSNSHPLVSYVTIFSFIHSLSITTHPTHSSHWAYKVIFHVIGVDRSKYSSLHDNFHHLNTYPSLVGLLPNKGRSHVIVA
jgi:hypothetical protein